MTAMSTFVKLCPEEAAARVAEYCAGKSKFFAQAGESFLAAVDRGEHDDQCEYLKVKGFYLCNCSKRRREAAGFTEPPGDLEWVSPICPRCDEHVDHDGDSWTCPRCRVYWQQDGTGAEFYDDYGDLDADLAKYEVVTVKRRQVVDVHLPEPEGEATTR